MSNKLIFVDINTPKEDPSEKRLITCLFTSNFANQNEDPFLLPDKFRPRPVNEIKNLS